ncbi:hypothetical protein [Streptomyces hokutonensis]|uniref:hypothetical protein n=1 Tax=Streptomyces hokutonensis TaxID=1306990 RepID=UPI0036BF678F
MITLAGDDRVGSRSADWSSDDPSVADVTEALARLDGKRRTEISIVDDAPFRFLTISGGPDLFLVTGELEDGGILHLKDPNGDEQEIGLVCGGQLGKFPRSHLVTAKEAVQAAVDFLGGFVGGLGKYWTVE